MSIRENSDSGKPPVVSDPTGPEAEAFRAIVRKILAASPALRA
jgi:ATP-binding protein involved in chromosome partitioning